LEGLVEESTFVTDGDW